MIQPDKYPFLICSFKLFEYCKGRYPKRQVFADPHVDYEEFYYWSRTGKFRIVINRKQIWINDHDRPPYRIRVR